MLWHVVKFKLRPDVPADERGGFEQELAGLAGRIPTLRFVRVAPSIDEPDVIGLLTGFDDVEGLEAYKVHPAHQPVLAAARALSAEIIRLDLVTADPSDTLALREP